MTDMIISIDGEATLGTKCPTHKLEIKERKMTSKETIQTVKEDIAILQEKLKKLEELARVKTPAEEAFYRIYSRYPDKLDDRYGSAWDIFVVGYNEAQKDAVENNKNFEPTPQTPEQVEQGLRDAMKQAKEDGVFEKPKPKTLYDVIYEWKYDTYDPTCDVLLDMIEEWLPDDELRYDDEEYEIGWNEAIQAIKNKLR